jgi:antitoxin component of MazEF toxin-antitoxin module
MKNIGVINFKVETWKKLVPDYQLNYYYDGENKFYVGEWKKYIRILYGEDSVRRFSDSSSLMRAIQFEYSSKVDLSVVNNLLIYKRKQKIRDLEKEISYSVTTYASSSSEDNQPRSRRQNQWYDQLNRREHWRR